LGLAYTVDITGTLQVFHTDGLGSVRAITDSSGNVVETFQSDEFGVPLMTQGSSPEPMRFTGQQRDAESGFYDLRARYYSPGLGRFLSRDPLFGSSANPLSLNRFSYAQDNPLNQTDPSGLASTTPNDPALGPQSSVSIALQNSYDPTLTGPNQDNRQSCSTSLQTFCLVLGQLPNGGAAAFILWDPCFLHPWSCKDEGGGASDRTETPVRFTTGKKIEDQMSGRGWTTQLIQDTLNNPANKVVARDTRHLPGGGAMNDPATAYIRGDRSYVIRNDLTGDIVQISNRNKANWKSPW
jgi:RHS repeat-associated protein